MPPPSASAAAGDRRGDLRVVLHVEREHGRRQSLSVAASLRTSPSVRSPW